MDRNNLIIVAWNANGILDHQEELQAFLYEQNVDICLLSETHLTKENHIRFKGYKVYHTTHPSGTARGGSAVIIKENIKHNEDAKLQSEQVQVTTVNIKTTRYNCTVGAAYIPPRHHLKKENYEQLLRQMGEIFILGGDFNAKNTIWGSRLTNTKGRELHDAARKIGCEYHSTGKPTYWPTDRHKIPDLLDFFITKKIPTNSIKVEENYDLDSDHSPVVLTLSENIFERENRPTLCNKNTDWDNFKFELSEKITLEGLLRTREQIDSEAEKLMIHIQQSAWNNTPVIKRKTIGNAYPREIKELIKKKRKARKKWQKTRCPRDKGVLNNLTQQLKREINGIKNESIHRYLRNLNNEKDTNYSLWKAARKFKRPIVHIPPIKQDDGNWARSNKQKCEIFADHLEKTFQPNEDPGCELPNDWDEDHVNNVNIVNIVNKDNEEIARVTPKEVLKEIMENINPRKAPGFDLITGEIMKNLPKKAIVKLTYIVNAAFRLKYVPSIWKVAEVLMILKPGKPPNEVKSYRPISLLPVISKLFEKLLLKRLKSIIDKKKLIPVHQFGFRNQHSTIDQVHRITNEIEKTLEEKKICSTLFLDVSQAFDRVWFQGLEYKLRKLLPEQYADILMSYVTNRIFRVKQEDEYSSFKDIKAGVPQGSVLGPILYLLYTSDIPETHNVKVATFADDTALLAVGKTMEESVGKLQQAANNIYDWTKKWRIRLNETKTVLVNFTNKRTIEHHPLVLNHSLIPYANTAKYLGMTLDAKLKWKEHIKKKLEELRIKYRKLFWLMNRRSQLSNENKLLIYKQIIKPTWTYGIQLWGCATKTNVNRIQVFQNKILRAITDAPWYVRNVDLHRDLEMPTVVEEIRNFARKHDGRLHAHVNIEALQLLDRHPMRRLKRTKPYELL